MKKTKITDERLEELLRSDAAAAANTACFSFSPRAAKITDRSEQTMPYRKTFVAVIAAAALLATIAASAFCVSFFSAYPDSGSVPDEPVSASDAGTAGSGNREDPFSGTESGNMPDVPPEKKKNDPDVPPFAVAVSSWYPSGTLVLRSVNEKGTQSAQAESPALLTPQVLKGFLSAPSVPVYRAQMIDLTSVIGESEHQGHAGAYFNVRTNQIVCWECLAKKALKTPLSDGEVLSFDKTASENAITFAIYDTERQKIKARYILYTDPERVVSLPVLSDNDIGTLIADSGMTAVVTHKTVTHGDSETDEVYLIDTATGNYRLISGGYPTYMQSYFSPDERFVINVMKNEQGITNDVFSKDALFLAYAIENGASVVCRGRIAAYRGDTVVTEAGDGFHVYDMVKGTEIPVQGTGRIFVCRDGKIGTVLPENDRFEPVCDIPDCYLISEDGGILFTYTVGDRYVSCRHAENTDPFCVELPDALVSDIRTKADTGRVSCRLYLDRDMDELLLLYSAVSAKFPSAAFANMYLQQQNNIRSIRDLYEAMLKNLIRSGEDLPDEYQHMAVYTGSRYLYLRIDQYCFVEDYRNGTFGAYFATDYMDEQVVLYVKTVADATETTGAVHRILPCKATMKETLAYLGEHNIPVETANFDFASVLTNGEFDRKKAEDVLFSDAVADCYSYCMCYIDTARSRYATVNDMACVRRFLRAVRENEHSVVEHSEAAEGGVLRRGAGILIGGTVTFDGFESTDGTYYLDTGHVLVRIAPEVYGELLSLCRSAFDG